jgi:hypothetical protein
MHGPSQIEYLPGHTLIIIADEFDGMVRSRMCHVLVVVKSKQSDSINDKASLKPPSGDMHQKKKAGIPEVRRRAGALLTARRL